MNCTSRTCLKFLFLHGGGGASPHFVCYCDSPEQWIEVSRKEEEKRKEEEEKEEEEEVSWTSSVMYFYPRLRREKILPPLSLVCASRDAVQYFVGRERLDNFSRCASWRIPPLQWNR